jgi:predicted AlkP superfamily phosphohydrolase/phosphomutase
MNRPAVKAGQMPALARFLEGGVRANIATLHPIISRSCGTRSRRASGDKHGILGFFEPDGKGGVRPVASTSRTAKAVWNILSQRGLRSTVLGGYASAPPSTSRADRDGPVRACGEREHGPGAG